MPRYKIIVAYDGTGYHGWQIQPDCLSVMQVLQNRFTKVFGEEINLQGVSRTDAGVHAAGQVAAFSTNLSLETEIMQRAWNGLLPSNILIRKISRVLDDYNPHADIFQKIYYYHFFTKRPLPFFSKYGFYYRFPLDLKKLEQCLDIFKGTHDFRSFCTGYERENTTRTIHEIKLIYIKKYKCYRIIIKGPGFLKYMIRRIVGACLEVSSSLDLTTSSLQIALEKKHPEQPFTTAAAHGLMLFAIRYNYKKGKIL